jgi:unsaturated rhamnogalacturonyl hydrolase
MHSSPSGGRLRLLSAGLALLASGIHLSAAETPRSWAVATAETIIRRNSGGGRGTLGGWSYWKGYTLCGFEMLWRYTGDTRYAEFIQREVDPFIDGQGNLKGVRFGWLDNTMIGNTVVGLYERTHDERYRVAATRIRDYFDSHPRNPDGGFWHADQLPGEMWSDGVFMGSMFLIRYGQSIGDRESCFAEAARQITSFARHARKGDTGLYYHAWAERPATATVWPNRTVNWADPKTGLSPEVWSEGLGWYTLVVAETLAVLPQDHPRRAEIAALFRNLAAGLKRTQDARSGRWFQVVDKGDRPDNWTDNSGSAMFTYAIQRGIDLKLLDREEYGPVAIKGYRGIVENAKINAEGLVDIYSACDGVCVQARYADYVNFRKKVNAKEAVGGFLWAAAIMERPMLEAARDQRKSASAGPAGN